QDAWHRFSDKGYRHYQVVECGFKYNMMDIQAAIGIHQLRRVERAWETRRAIWGRYQEELAGVEVSRPAEPEADTVHAYHLYTIGVDAERCGMNRDEFLGAMNAARIGTGVHYLSVAEHPYYQQHLGWRPEQWPVATRVGRQTVSLPLSPKLTTTD